MSPEEQAANAPAGRKVRAFVEWVGAGRPVAQAGRIRPADGLALVELLDTGDVLDPRFPVRSSADLHHLSLIVEWAIASRLVRVVRGRIVPVSAHARLLDRPLELVGRMLDALPGLGDKLGDSAFGADAAHTVEAVLGELVGRGGRLTLEHAGEVAWNTVLLRYHFPNATELQMGWQRRNSDGDVRRMLEAVADLGLLDINDGHAALTTTLGQENVPPWLGMGTPQASVLRLRVSLRESTGPAIWRRLRVPADIRLDRFHQVLGAAMGWEDSHLHVFELGSAFYGFPDPDLDISDDREMTLGGLVSDPGDRLEYEYDFGDAWEHDIVLEAIEDGDDQGPRCVDGAGRCPPEDVGGIHGYEHLKRVLADAAHFEHSQMLDWLGLEDARAFDPAAFGVDAANEAVASVLLSGPQDIVAFAG